MKFLVIQVFFVIFLMQLIENIENLQLFPNCGWSKKSGGGLSFGGKDSERAEAPWKVAIFKKEGSGTEKYICGGSLISDDVILTAAHCVHDKAKALTKAEELSIKLGAHDLSDENEQDREVRGVRKIVIHGGWSSMQIRYNDDIAILKLDSPVQFSVYIQPICLFTDDKTLSNSSGRVASWGEVNDNHENADKAQIIDLEIIDLARCLIYDSSLVTFHWVESFCAKSDVSGVCQGDSGSGLFVEINERYFLKGIVSSSVYRDCSQKSIALYSDVTKYFQFIKENFRSQLKFECVYRKYGYPSSLEGFPQSNYYNCTTKDDENLSDNFVNKISTNLKNSDYDDVKVITLEMKILPKFSKNLMSSTFKNLFELSLNMKSNPKSTKEIPEFIKNFGNFQFLRLEFCEINENSKNILNEMIKVEFLVLEHCSFKTSIPSDFLKSQSELKYLWMESSEIEELPTDIFSGMKLLERLHLNDNKIASLPPDFFKMHVNLEQLYLNGNQIMILPLDLFKMNVNLEILHLDENQIEGLPENIFSSLKKLKELWLNKNQIEVLPKKLLVNNLELETFIIWGNKIKQISIDFKTLPKLTRLHLSGNECCVPDNDCNFDSKEIIQNNLNDTKEKCK